MRYGNGNGKRFLFFCPSINVTNHQKENLIAFRFFISSDSFSFWFSYFVFFGDQTLTYEHSEEKVNHRPCRYIRIVFISFFFIFLPSDKSFPKPIYVFKFTHCSATQSKLMRRVSHHRQWIFSHLKLSNSISFGHSPLAHNEHWTLVNNSNYYYYQLTMQHQLYGILFCFFLQCQVVYYIMSRALSNSK